MTKHVHGAKRWRHRRRNWVLGQLKILGETAIFLVLATLALLALR